MKVYHGTSGSLWELIKKQGLQVRGSHGVVSNWSHSVESNPDTVYFTTDFPYHFALAAMNLSELGKSEKLAVLIEVDTDDLPGRLVPDEDALEQAGRKNDGLPETWGMVRRTRYYRGLVKQFSDFGFDWEWSLNTLGTMGHVGDVPASCFSRVALVDVREEKELSFYFMDVSVACMSHSILGANRRNVIRSIFGDSDFEPELVPENRPRIRGSGITILTREDIYAGDHQAPSYATAC